MRPVLLFGFASLMTTALLAQPGAPPPQLMACGGPAGAGAEILCGARSPEDLELMPGGKGLIVAQYVTFQNAKEQGGIALFDFASKRYTPIPITVAADKSWGDPACPGPVGDQLAAHGSSLVKRTNGAWQYFLVNHGGRESIEMFELKVGAGGPSLVWHGCVIAEKAYNDVAALADGGYVATHPTAMQGSGQGGGILFDGTPSGWVSRWTPGKGEAELAGTRFGYPNGVVTSPDGRFAYYAAWTAKEIHKYDLKAGKDVTVTKLDFMPDNITWTRNGKLLAAGVKGGRGAGSCGAVPCVVAFGVAQLDPGGIKVEKKFDSGDRTLISGVSVALQVGPTIYVGSFQGDRLVKLDWKQ